MKKLKTAIIGCGNIHQVHADIIKNSDNTELEYVVDIKENRAKKSAEKYNCKYLTDYKDLLDKNLDSVHICTPHFLHSSMAIDFLNSEINVLVEKPLALNYKEAQKVIKADQNSSAKLGVCFQNRFNENIQRAREIIDSSELGELKGIKGIVTWHRDQNYYLKDDWKGYYKTEGGGVLINQAIHTLDLIQWFGGEIEAVKGNIDTRVLEDIIEVEDTADATLYFKNNAVGIFYATNGFSANSPVEIVVDFEKGSLRLFGDQLFVQKENEIKQFSEEKESKYKAYWGYGHQKLIESFYQAIINNNNKNLIKAEEGIKTLELINKINNSSKKRKKYYLNQ
ncbi:Gfo/Idh/MocA family protein [Halanaerobium saccharolyticum]|jgi:predicted dehydrogenase|uniref:Putative dehydrogenase n=1 Tax=Halanaerobium saccharolyticum TaxID=43595 RepID=A0A2T5RI97_9FIRM|nr:MULTISPECIES: Gfo/Idh/MocA family oxidoreductase [Halanaerobium]PTV97937.1 putative dehydrogenase [Halanaerobium saccharolyticum]PUU92903.1 MAG: putative dehydrogenase [Halanaerobium sp.]